MGREVLAYVLAAIWLVYGRGHFVYRAEVVREVPSVIPLKDFIVSATGMAEIVLALLLIPRGTRTYAGWGTIVLLVLYVPAILNMVIYDVFPDGWSRSFRITVRAVAIPHNIVLGLWAYWLIKAAP